MTIEEYFAFEERSPIRHEYVDGEVYAMSGATRRHNAIAGNVYVRLRTATRGGPCRVHMSEVKLHLGRIIYYPDVMAACGPEPADERIEDAPCLVVEVLSHEAIADQGTIPLPCEPLGGLSLTMDEIYEGVTMPTPEQRLRLREEELAYG